MKHRHFRRQLDEARVVAAIHQAEQQTSGEIRVFLSHKAVEDALAAAQRQFLRLGLHRTRHRNAVLIFVAPRTHQFAVVGDAAVHARCGDAFWTEVTAEMTAHFKAGAFTAAIVHGVQKAGRLLAEHFPRQPDDRNELPDAVAHD